MGKSIRSHPPEIQALIRKLYEEEKYRNPYRESGVFDDGWTVDQALSWSSTPQGHMFWNDIDNGDYKDPKKSGHWHKPLDEPINDFQIF